MRTLDYHALLPTGLLTVLGDQPRRTYVHREGGSESAIDDIVISQDLLPRVLSRQVVYAEGFQHNAVVVDIAPRAAVTPSAFERETKFTFRVAKRAPDVNYMAYVLDLARRTQPLMESWTRQLEEGFETVSQERKQLIVDEATGALEREILAAAEANLAKVAVKRRGKPWFTADVRTAYNVQKTRHRAMVNVRDRVGVNPSPAEATELEDAVRQHKAAKAEYTRTIYRSRYATAKERLDFVMKTGLSSKEAWRVIKGSGTADSSAVALQLPNEEDGELTSTRAETASVFRHAYAELATASPPPPERAAALAAKAGVVRDLADSDLIVDGAEDSPISPVEVEVARRRLKAFKAAGPAQIFGELLRVAPVKKKSNRESTAAFDRRRAAQREASDDFTHALVALFSLVWTTETVPSSWTTAWLHPIRKPGKSDLTDPMSYRTIAVVPTMAKLFDSIMTARLQAKSRSQRTGEQRLVAHPNAAGGFAGTHIEDLILAVTEALSRRQVSSHF